jgi:hypothetical protein
VEWTASRCSAMARLAGLTSAFNSFELPVPAVTQ